MRAGMIAQLALLNLLNIVWKPKSQVIYVQQYLVHSTLWPTNIYKVHCIISEEISLADLIVADQTEFKCRLDNLERQNIEWKRKIANLEELTKKMEEKIQLAESELRDFHEQVIGSYKIKFIFK